MHPPNRSPQTAGLHALRAHAHRDAGPRLIAKPIRLVHFSVLIALFGAIGVVVRVLLERAARHALAMVVRSQIVCVCVCVVLLRAQVVYVASTSAGGGAAQVASCPDVESLAPDALAAEHVG